MYISTFAQIELVQNALRAYDKLQFPRLKSSIAETRTMCTLSGGATVTKLFGPFSEKGSTLNGKKSGARRNLL